MLSNTNAIHWHIHAVIDGFYGAGDGRLFRPHIPVLPDASAKPDERIFRKVLSEAGLKPEETLFVDDSFRNCRMAESLGIQVFHSRSRKIGSVCWSNDGGE